METEYQQLRRSQSTGNMVECPACGGIYNAYGACPFCEEQVPEQSTRILATPYYGVKTWENGTTGGQWFTDYQEMARWLAASPEAGIYATDGGVPIDQGELQQDVAAYQG